MRTTPPTELQLISDQNHLCARLVFLALCRPVPVQVDEQWDTAVETDSECSCFKMAALPEKKRTSPQGADTLTGIRQSVDSSALKINIKERDDILFICGCVWEHNSPVSRTDESVVPHRTQDWFTEILHYSPWVRPVSECIRSKEGWLNIWRSLIPHRSNSQFWLWWLKLIVGANCPSSSTAPRWGSMSSLIAPWRHHCLIILSFFPTFRLNWTLMKHIVCTFCKGL